MSFNRRRFNCYGARGSLAGKTYEQHRLPELDRERREVAELPERGADELREILKSFGFDAAQAETVVNGSAQIAEISLLNDCRFVAHSVLTHE